MDIHISFPLVWVEDGVGGILQHLSLKKAKPIPHMPGNCREKNRGWRKRLSTKNSPRTLADQTELIFILQALAALEIRLFISSREKDSPLTGETAHTILPLINLNLQVTGTPHLRTTHSDHNGGLEEDQVTEVSLGFFWQRKEMAAPAGNAA